MPKVVVKGEKWYSNMGGFYNYLVLYSVKHAVLNRLFTDK